MQLSYAGASDVGRVREENQDAIGLPHHPLSGDGVPLFVLADGMGGRQGGGLASRMAVATLQEHFARDESRDPRQTLRKGVQKASLAILQKAEDEPQLQGMGTTIVALAIRDGLAVVANVGDSRAYIFRGGRLRQITEDHSLVAQQVRQGLLSLQEAKSSPLRHIITKAAGAMPNVEPDVFHEHLEDGDILLMCSDGLHGPVEEAQIAKVLSSRQPLTDQVGELLKQANQAGGPDNISVILVRVDNKATTGEMANVTGDLTEKLPGGPASQQDPAAGGSAMTKPFVYLVPLAAAALGLWWYFSNN
ncbi:MAG: Stp1/IreP family PP2C-type Ser/Thr phosphatase [Desulfarculus sp.]|nr:Stp1/IreP family PP2C-type Ser/Thr phosphatase [Desulfarculus sp.]